MNAHAGAEQFQTFSEFAAAVVRSTSGLDHDDRLKRFSAPTGLSESGGSAGGFAVPTDIAAEVWTRVYNTGRIISRCADQPVTKASGVIIPAVSEGSRADGQRFGGVRMYWVDEGTAPVASKPKLDVFNMILKKALGIVYVTDELLQDAPALDAFLRRAFAMEAEFAIEDRIINGNGAGTLGGVLASSALITVPKEIGQGDGTVTYNNLAAMVAQLWGPSHRNAVWLMSNDVFQQVMTLTAPDGSLVVENGDNGVRRMFSMPIELCEYTPALGIAGDVLLADFSQYLLARQDSTFEQSIHVQFVTDETAFKVRYRVEGQPAWSAPVTPKNSSVLQSPFVTLGARLAA